MRLQCHSTHKTGHWKITSYDHILILFAVKSRVTAIERHRTFEGIIHSGSPLEEETLDIEKANNIALFNPSCWYTSPHCRFHRKYSVEDITYVIDFFNLFGGGIIYFSSLAWKWTGWRATDCTSEVLHRRKTCKDRTRQMAQLLYWAHRIKMLLTLEPQSPIGCLPVSFLIYWCLPEASNFALLMLTFRPPRSTEVLHLSVILTAFSAISAVSTISSKYRIIRELVGGGWHWNQTRAHCHKFLDLNSEDPKTWIYGEKCVW